MKALALLLLVVACGKSSDDKKYARCGDAASAAMSAGIGKDADRAKFAAMVDIVTGRCTDDKWSRDAIECFAGAKARADVKACNAKLTKDQNEAMNRAMREIMAGHEKAVDDKMAKADAEMDGLIGAIPKARAAHPDDACPTIAQLLVVEPNLSEKDPWGQPYRIQCGSDVPGGEVMIWSAGPDHAFESGDDLHVVR